MYNKKNMDNMTYSDCFLRAGKYEEAVSSKNPDSYKDAIDECKLEKVRDESTWLLR